MIFILKFNGDPIPVKDTLRGLMPLFGRPLWFASAYIFLILLSPYLKLIFKLEPKKLMKLTVLLFIMLCVISSLPDKQSGYVVDSLFFIYVYIFIGFYKKIINQYINKQTALVIGVMGILIYIIMILMNNLIYMCGSNSITKFLYDLSTQYLGDIKTIPNFSCALFIFIFFLNIDMGQNKHINSIAKPTFAIYIIHQVPIFIPFLWNNIFRCYLWPKTSLIIIYCIIATALIYVFGMFIDSLRIKYIEKLWINSKLYNFVYKSINKIYSDM